MGKLLQEYSSYTIVSTHCDCPATVHLIYTMENGSVPLKNGLIQLQSKKIMIFFLKSSQQKIRSWSISLVLNSIIHEVSLKIHWQNFFLNGFIFYKITLPRLERLYTPGQDPNNSASQPCEELKPPLRKRCKLWTMRK